MLPRLYITHHPAGHLSGYLCWPDQPGAKQLGVFASYRSDGPDEEGA